MSANTPGFDTISCDLPPADCVEGDDPPPQGGRTGDGEGGDAAVGETGGERGDVLQLVIDHEDTPAGLERYLRNHLPRLIEAAGVDVAELGVAVVDDEAMAELHRRHMGIDGPTDVLTFDLSDRPGEVVGDVAICLDEARRQAAERGHAVELEVLLYALHAVLHLTGYDDVDEASAAAMHAREDELLRAVGLPAVYASGEPPVNGALAGSAAEDARSPDRWTRR